MADKNDFGMVVTPTRENIDALLKGSIDMHVHVAPDATVVRRCDTIETALAAQAAGQRAFVAKSFFYPTTVVAAACKHAAPDVKVFGSVVIGYATTAGLDNAALVIRTHAELGCKVVWFPAFDAENCKKGLKQEGGINILDENGKLKPQVYDILAVCKEYHMVVCSGHMSFAETEALFMACNEIGITKMVATHPLVQIWPRFTYEQMHRCVELGAVIEHCFVNTQPRAGSYDPMLYVNATHEVGAENCLISTDFAQITDPTPAEGMRSFIAMMLQFGCTPEEVEWMCQKNPARLLDLDE